jgi:uncharacterized protein (TIGR02246 family)
LFADQHQSSAAADLCPAGARAYRFGMDAIDRPSSETSEQAMASLIDRWGFAWNAHDADALARLVSDDVRFVTVAGKRLLGRAEFHDHHRSIHAGQMRDSAWRTLGWEQRSLPGGLLLAHVEWTIDGDCDADLRPRPRRFGVFTWIVAASAGRMAIVAAHNTNLDAGVEHRTAAAVNAMTQIEGGPP